MENKDIENIKQLLNITNNEVDELIRFSKETLAYDLMTKKRKDLAYKRASNNLDNNFIKNVKEFLCLEAKKINKLNKDECLRYLEISEIFISKIPVKFLKNKKGEYVYDKRFSLVLQIHQSLKKKCK